MRLLMVILIFASCWIAPRIEALEVKDATIDLSQWDGTSTILLNGTWLSIENELVEGAQLAAHVQTPIPVPTPADFKAPAEPLPGQRTYILHVKGLKVDRPVSLLLNSMAVLSLRFLFVHEGTGQHYELGQIGKVDPDPHQRVHVYTGSNALALPPVDGNGILLIQANAYPFYKGVPMPFHIPTPIEMGPTQVLLKKTQIHAYEESFTLGLFALMALFNLALFIQRPVEKGTLFLFGLACSFALRYVCTDGILHRIFEPTLGLYQWTVAGLAFTPMSSGLMLALFLRSTYPRQVPRLFPIVLAVLLLFMVVKSLMTSVNQVQSQWIFYSMIVLILFLYACFVSLRAALAREEGATLGICGIAVIFVGHFNDFFVATNTYQFLYLGHYSLVLFIFAQSLVVGRRFALTFERSVMLGRELQVKNEALMQQKAEIQSLNESLRDYSETLEHKVEEKTRDIVSILNNIRQGIVAVKSPAGELAKEHSLHLHTMLGIQSIEGRNVMDLCFAGSDVSDDQMDQLRNALAVIIGEDALAFDLNQNALPAAIKRTATHGVQILELDWSPVMAGTRVEKILLVMRDVTEIQRLRLEAEDQAAELKLIADIINVPKERFEGLMTATLRLIEANRDLLAQIDLLDAGLIDRLYRNLHTVKGMMRSYQLRQITEVVHAAENRYKDVKGGAVVETPVLQADLERILNLVRRMVDVNRHKLGRSSVQDHHYILIDKRQFEDNLRNIREIDFQVLQTEDQSRFERIRTLFYKVAYTSLHKVIEAQLEALPHLAQSLNKNPPTTTFIDQGFSINREIHETMNNVFTHLLRNSIDHGLESNDFRIAQGKSPAGRITFQLSAFHDQLRIDYFDDGRGLDLQKVQQKAREKGLLTAAQEVTHQHLVDFILQPDFSTSERVTDISGRGVGMDAVRAFIEDIDGTFAIRVDEPNSMTLKSIPAHFIIILPEKHFQRIGAPEADQAFQAA